MLRSIPGWRRSLWHYQPGLPWARPILKAVTRSDAACALGLEAEGGADLEPLRPQIAAGRTRTSHHLHPSCLLLHTAHPAQAPVEVSFPNPIKGKPKVGFPMLSPNANLPRSRASSSREILCGQSRHPGNVYPEPGAPGKATREGAMGSCHGARLGAMGLPAGAGGAATTPKGAMLNCSAPASRWESCTFPCWRRAG